MSARLMLVCSAAMLCVWGSASTAQAQIYMLRQADGTIVLSDKPLGPGARTFAVERTTTNVRATRPTTGGSYSSSYDSLIEEHASRQNLRPDLVRAVIQVESGFNPHATSNKGDEALALAAYNAGAGAVTRYGDAIPPYRETRQYVERIRSRSSLYTGGAAPIYKWTETVDGREVTRYSNIKPKTANYRVVQRPRAITMPADDDEGTK